MEDTGFTNISGSSSKSEVSAAGIVSLTEAVEDALEAVTVAVTGAETADITEAVTGAVAWTRVAWWQAARRRLRSLSAGPR